MRADHDALRRAVRTAALLNITYFFVEFAVALHIGSVSLLADSADFFEDSACSFLILLALGWDSRRRAKVGFLLSAVLLAPAIAFLWTLWSKISLPIPPAGLPLGLTGAGALAINLFCAFRLAAYRHHAGSLSRAAFLSARNDVLANIAIIGAGALTLAMPSIWPDVVVGFGIAIMNLDAAREVWTAARDEHRVATAQS
jgi:Co/Zn/Cd efflux system component